MTRFLLSSLVLAFLTVTLGTGCGDTAKKENVPANNPTPPKDPKGGSAPTAM